MYPYVLKCVVHYDNLEYSIERVNQLSVNEH